MKSEWKKTAQVEIDDAYKWLFQATRGGEHAVPNEQMAREWLDREWLKIGEPLKNEQVWQPLCKDGSIGRLNLRPFRVRGGRSEDLLGAFVRSSQSFDQSKDNFISAWTELGKRLKKKAQGKLTYSEWEKLDLAMKAKNYPAVHHSKTYGDALLPAYRVVTGAEAKKLTRALSVK